jgi:N-acyl-D-aspartate/D-glutamate deacylase
VARVRAQVDRRDAALRGSPDPIDAVCDLLAATADDVSRLWTIELVFTVDEQHATFVHPLCVPASDAAALAPDGALAQSTFHGAYGWASWFYRYMVREKRLLSLEQAIHKLTAQPASILGLRDRGTLAAGNIADLAVFDPGTYADRETMYDANRPAGRNAARRRRRRAHDQRRRTDGPARRPRPAPNLICGRPRARVRPPRLTDPSRK